MEFHVSPLSSWIDVFGAELGPPKFVNGAPYRRTASPGGERAA